MTDQPDTGGVAADRLKSLIERVERLTEEKATLAQDIKEVFSEAKGAGYDVAAMRKVISLRRLDPNERQEADHLLEVYRAAVGV